MICFVSYVRQRSHLLHPARNRASLRTRGHSYQLSEYSTYLHKKSFLIRCLYSFVKWNSFWFCCFVLYVILTLIFMFIIWCESVASNKITYIHNCSRAQCVSVTSSTQYWLISDYRHCSKLGRLVLNTCFPLGLFTMTYANLSLVQFVRCAPGTQS